MNDAIVKAQFEITFNFRYVSIYSATPLCDLIYYILLLYILVMLSFQKFPREEESTSGSEMERKKK